MKGMYPSLLTPPLYITDIPPLALILVGGFGTRLRPLVSGN